MTQKNNTSTNIKNFFEVQVENGFATLVKAVRLFFIAFMIIYLIACLFSISNKLYEFILMQGTLDFPSMKILLTDALFTLIVLAIVKALFINDSFVYALTFLEIAFVVVIRKLILLDTIPEENWTLLILGLISTSFFILIIYIHNLKRRWQE
ncbi:hypothetical protein [Thiomicrorhabdus indica]|uniref:hypothetical protein n=2 Tax=Thiomicrorhabdus indica TaxID=2267253 RepID=UPI00102E0A29|nr:hypothetical protein [Thiomicrorhabdus indica]